MNKNKQIGQTGPNTQQKKNISEFSIRTNEKKK